MADLNFLVGETVHLRVRVSKAGTKTPYSPGVVRLTSLALDGAPVALPPTVDFTRTVEGEFLLILDTSVLLPGVYSAVITLTDGATAVRLLRGSFVLDGL